MREKINNEEIELEKVCDKVLSNIKSGQNTLTNLDLMKLYTEDSNEARAGYAANLLRDLYRYGKYVHKDPEMENHYYKIGIEKKETNCLILNAKSTSTSGEEYEKKLLELIKNGATRQYLIWRTLANIRKKKNGYLTKTFKSAYFIRMKYYWKAFFSAPSSPYYKNIRKSLRRQALRFSSPLISVGLVILVLLFASMG